MSSPTRRLSEPSGEDSPVLASPLGTRHARTGMGGLLRRPSRAEIQRPLDGLPPVLAEIVRRTLTRSRLWRSEQLDLARELAAHFADGLEAGRTPEQLAAEFGDVERAAQLIRRAKKRSRPLWFKAWRGALRVSVAGLALLAAVYVVLAARYYTGRPTIRRNYLAELNAPALATPVDQRAWPLYEQALRTITPPPEALSLQPGLVRIDWSEAAWTEVETWVSANAEPLALVRRAAGMPHLGHVMNRRASADFLRAMQARPQRGTPAGPAPTASPAPEQQEPADEALLGVSLFHLGYVRELGHLLYADCLMGTRAGDAGRVGADIDALLNMASHLRQQPFIVSELMAGSIDLLAFEAIEQAVAESPDLLPREGLQALAHRIAGMGDPSERMAGVLNTERAFFEDAVQRMYTDDGRGNGRITAAGMKWVHAALGSISMSPAESPGAGPLGPIIAGLAVDRREATRFYNLALDRVAAGLHMPPWARGGTSPDTELVAALESPTGRLRYWPASLLVPALGALIRTADHQRQHADAVLVAIALELYRRDHEAYPDDLALLVPRQLPVTPMDMFTGRPLRYKLANGRPLVYSVGVDGDDDGGVPPAAGNQMAAHLPPSAAMPDVDVRQGHDGDWVLYPMPRQPAGGDHPAP